MQEVFTEDKLEGRKSVCVCMASVEFRTLPQFLVASQFNSSRSSFSSARRPLLCRRSVPRSIPETRIRAIWETLWQFLAIYSHSEFLISIYVYFKVIYATYPRTFFLFSDCAIL